MTGTISFAGVGSGLDVNSIIDGLVNASSGRLNAIKSRATNVRSANSTLSSISTSLSSLATAVKALATVKDANSYTATSSGSQVVATTSGDALPGSFKVEVSSLASEERRYSQTFSSNLSALNLSGTLNLQVGTGAATPITIDATDSLENVARKINAAGLRVSASVFNDGSNYRLQLRGLDTGAANTLTVSGTQTLGLNQTGAAPGDGKTVQAASDASILIDGYTVTRPTNQITGAIPGVTLALTDKTTSPVTIKVDSDPTALKTKINSVISSYNSVVSAVHSAAGFGTTKAYNDALAGNSTLRGITDQLSSAVYSLPSAASASQYQMLADIGISLNQDGTLKLDDTKLSSAVSKDPSRVSSLLSDRMASMKTMIDQITKSDSGSLSLAQKAFTDQAKDLDDQATREQTRLDTYAESLRKRFTEMDTQYSASQAQLTQLQKYFG